MSSFFCFPRSSSSSGEEGNHPLEPGQWVRQRPALAWAEGEVGVEVGAEVVARAYRKAGYLTMVIAGYIPANSQLAAAIATIVKSLSIGK